MDSHSEYGRVGLAQCWAGTCRGGRVQAGQSFLQSAQLLHSLIQRLERRDGSGHRHQCTGRAGCVWGVGRMQQSGGGSGLCKLLIL